MIKEERKLLIWLDGIKYYKSRLRYSRDAGAKPTIGTAPFEQSKLGFLAAIHVRKICDPVSHRAFILEVVLKTHTFEFDPFLSLALIGLVT